MGHAETVDKILKWLEREGKTAFLIALFCCTVAHGICIHICVHMRAYRTSDVQCMMSIECSRCTKSHQV